MGRTGKGNRKTWMLQLARIQNIKDLTADNIKILLGLWS